MTDSPVSRREKRKTEAGPIGLEGMNSTWYLPHFVLDFSWDVMVLKKMLNRKTVTGYLTISTPQSSVQHVTFQFLSEYSVFSLNITTYILQVLNNFSVEFIMCQLTIYNKVQTGCTFKVPRDFESSGHSKKVSLLAKLCSLPPPLAG